MQGDSAFCGGTIHEFRVAGAVGWVREDGTVRPSRRGALQSRNDHLLPFRLAGQYCLQMLSNCNSAKLRRSSALERTGQPNRSNDGVGFPKVTAARLVLLPVRFDWWFLKLKSGPKRNHGDDNYSLDVDRTGRAGGKLSRGNASFERNACSFFGLQAEREVSGTSAGRREDAKRPPGTVEYRTWKD